MTRLDALGYASIGVAAAIAAIVMVGSAFGFAQPSAPTNSAPESADETVAASEVDYEAQQAAYEQSLAEYRDAQADAVQAQIDRDWAAVLDQRTAAQAVAAAEVEARREVGLKTAEDQIAAQQRASAAALQAWLDEQRAIALSQLAADIEIRDRLALDDLTSRLVETSTVGAAPPPPTVVFAPAPIVTAVVAPAPTATATPAPTATATPAPTATATPAPTATATATPTPTAAAGHWETLTFTPTDDTTVRENRPDRNLGADAKLEVDADSVKSILLRFDVSGVGTSTIARVTLWLFATNGSSFGGEVFRVTDTAWSEASVTWNTAPAGDGGSLGLLGDVTAELWYDLDVTSLVTGDGVVSVRITSPSANGADYISKEGDAGYAPKLMVQHWDDGSSSGQQ